MRRPVASLLVLALAGLAAAALAACGEEDAELLPGETAREITANLDTVQQLADEGDCIGAESAALQVSEQVEAVSGVDPRLQRALSEGADRLNEVVVACEEAPEEESEFTEPEIETTPSDGEEKEREKEERQEEKEAEKERREEEREEIEKEPLPPPQSEGEDGEDGDDGESGPSGSEGEGSPSGGVSPSNPVDGD